MDESKLDTPPSAEIDNYANVPILMLAGGASTRMRMGPEKKLQSRAKPLVSPYGRETLIDIVLDRIGKAGFKKLHLLTRTGPEAQGERIQRYVQRGIGPRLENKEVSLSFNMEEEPLGTAGAVNKTLSELGLKGNAVITPTDTDFPFDKLPQVIGNHLAKDSKITWVVTSIPGDNTQNVGKVLTNKDSDKIEYNLEAGNLSPDEVDPSARYNRRTSVGVLVVSSEYFREKFSHLLRETPDLDGKPVDLYRDFIPFVLTKGDPVNTFDIQKPAPDLGTPERLRRFVQEAKATFDKY